MSFQGDVEADINGVFLTDFAETVVYSVQGNPVPFTIQALFEYPAHDQEFQDMARVTSQNPRLTLREADVPGAGAKRGDSVVVRRVTYNVMAFNADGYGLVRAELHRRTP